MDSSNNLQTGLTEYQQQELQKIQSSYSHNNAPILDLKQIVQHVKNNMDFFRLITIIPSSSKFVTQIKPELNKLPAVGFTVDFGSITGNLVNTSMAQIMDIIVCCTVVMPVANDLSGAGSHYSFTTAGFPALSRCLYNWTPETTGRYTNPFQLYSFQRIENLCDNAYEVYCVYYKISCQIDYMDGYIPNAKLLTEINADIKTEKNNQISDDINFEITLN